MPYVAAERRPTSRRPVRCRQPASTTERTLGHRAGGRRRQAWGWGPTSRWRPRVNPDFGQVEADPAEVNLTRLRDLLLRSAAPSSPRGSQLPRASNGAGYFYSRRIGAAPRARVEADYVDYPRASTILGRGQAAPGALASGTSVGRAGRRSRTATDARTYVVDTPGAGRWAGCRVAAPRRRTACCARSRSSARSRSTAGLSLTGAAPRRGPGEPAAGRGLPRTALVSGGGGPGTCASDGGDYELRGYAGASCGGGSRRTPSAACRRSSARYFQRPDARLRRAGPARRTSLAGLHGGAERWRNAAAAAHWLWSSRDGQHRLARLRASTTRAGCSSPTTSARRRAGRLPRDRRRAARSAATRITGRPRERAGTTAATAPGAAARRGPAATSPGATSGRPSTARWTWTIPRSASDLTRGGPLLGTGPGVGHRSVQLENRGSARLPLVRGGVCRGPQRSRASASGTRGRRRDRLPPGPAWRLSVEPAATSASTEPRQYVVYPRGRAVRGHGRRYVFGSIEPQHAVDPAARDLHAEARLVNIDLYAEPFAASGRYERLRRVARVARPGPPGSTAREGRRSALQPDGGAAP